LVLGFYWDFSVRNGGCRWLGMNTPLPPNATELVLQARK
jgi:hypothetical protein